MVLGITDAKGLTNHVARLRSTGKAREVGELYRDLFVAHQTLLRAFPDCQWELVKTTGDGVMFFSDQAPCKQHLQTLPALQAEVRRQVANGEVGLRVIACYLNPEEIVRAQDICKDAADCGMNWLANDLFGHRLNIAFRLLSSVSADAAVVDHELLHHIYPLESKDYAPFESTELRLGFLGPVPVTSLKGISDIGFSAEGAERQPRWLWEVVKRDEQA